MEKQKRHTARIWQWLIPIIAILLLSLSSQGAAYPKAIPSEICNPTEKALDNINKERHNLAYMVDNASTVNFSNTLQRNLRNLQQQLKRDNKDESKTFATYANTQVSTLEYTNNTKYRKGLLKKSIILDLYHTAHHNLAKIPFLSFSLAEILPPHYLYKL